MPPVAVDGASILLLRVPRPRTIAKLDLATRMSCSEPTATPLALRLQLRLRPVLPSAAIPPPLLQVRLQLKQVVVVPSSALLLPLWLQPPVVLQLLVNPFASAPLRWFLPMRPQSPLPLLLGVQALVGGRATNATPRILPGTTFVPPAMHSVLENRRRKVSGL